MRRPQEVSGLGDNEVRRVRKKGRSGNKDLEQQRCLENGQTTAAAEGRGTAGHYEDTHPWVWKG